MQGCASVVVCAVEIGIQLENTLDVRSCAFASHEHQCRDVAVHDWLVDREQLLQDFNDRLDLAFVDGCHDNGLGAERLAVRVLYH